MPILAAGSTSIMISRSLSARWSPRADEPNSAACRTPRSRSAASFLRNRAMISWLSMGLYIVGAGARRLPDRSHRRGRRDQLAWAVVEVYHDVGAINPRE